MEYKDQRVLRERLSGTRGAQSPNYTERVVSSVRRSGSNIGSKRGTATNFLSPSSTTPTSGSSNPELYRYSYHSPTAAAGKQGNEQQRKRWRIKNFPSAPPLDDDTAVLLTDLQDVDPSGESIKMFLQGWLDRYLVEGEHFESKLLFCEVKLQELFRITARLPRPNPFRTWICCDLLMHLVPTFQGKKAQEVLSKIIEVVLGAVYTDEESEVGLVPYALKARSLEERLLTMIKRHEKATGNLEDIQMRWTKVLSAWHPAILRSLNHWTLPLKALVFSYWRNWVRRKRERRGEHKATSFYNRIGAVRRRFEIRTTAAAMFLEWRFITLKNKTRRMHSDREDITNRNDALTNAVKKARRVKYTFKDKLDEMSRELEETLEKEHVLQAQVSDCQSSEHELERQIRQSKEMIQVFASISRVVVAGLIDSTRRMLVQNYQDPSFFTNVTVPVYEGGGEDGGDDGDAQDEGVMAAAAGDDAAPKLFAEAWLDHQLAEYIPLRKAYIASLDPVRRGASASQSRPVSSTSNTTRSGRETIARAPQVFDQESFLSFLMRKSLPQNLRNPDPSSYSFMYSKLITLQGSAQAQEDVEELFNADLTKDRSCTSHMEVRKLLGAPPKIDLYVLDQVAAIDRQLKTRRPLGDPLPKGCREALGCWLANAFPASPPDFDDLLLAKEELKSTVHTYCSNPELIVHYEQLDGIVKLIRHMKEQIVARHEQANLDHLLWKQHVQRSEKIVTDRLVRRMHLSDIAMDSNSQHVVTKKYQRATPVLRDLVEAAIPKPLQASLLPDDDDDGDDGSNRNRVEENTEKEEKAQEKAQEEEEEEEETETETEHKKTKGSTEETEEKEKEKEQEEEEEEEEEKEEKEEENLEEERKKRAQEQANAKRQRALEHEERYRLLVNEWSRTVGTEVENCELLLGKQLVQLRKLFLSVADEKAIDDGLEKESLMTNFQFWRVVRHAQLPSKYCTPTQIDALFAEKLANKNKVLQHVMSERGGASKKDLKGKGVQGLSLDDFIEIAVRIAELKFQRKAPTLSQRIQLLLKDHLFLAKTAKAESDFRASLMTSQFETICARHNTWLETVFRAYAYTRRRDMKNGDAGLFLTLKEFEQFVVDAGLLAGHVLSKRQVREVFDNVQMDDDTDDTDEKTSGAGGDDYSGEEEMIYYEFVEGVAALACFRFKNPYLPVESKVDEFITQVLQSSPDVEKKRKDFVVFERKQEARKKEKQLAKEEKKKVKAAD